jgi:hypothetical protein
MDLMEDEGLKKSVIDQMMGELDDVTADSLRKPKGPVDGVEIAITVSPKSGKEMAEEMPEGEECTDPDCEIPEHHHEAMKKEGDDDSDYIGQLLRKMG